MSYSENPANNQRISALPSETHKRFIIRLLSFKELRCDKIQKALATPG